MKKNLENYDYYFLATLFAITVNHIFLNTGTSLLALIVCSISVTKKRSLFFLIIVYGYLTQTLINPDETRIHYTISCLIGIIFSIKNKFSNNYSSKYKIDNGILLALYVLTMTILMSEIISPITTIAGSNPFTRIFDILITLLSATLYDEENDFHYAPISFAIASTYLSCFYIISINKLETDSLRQALISGDVRTDPNYIAYYLTTGLGVILANIKSTLALKSNTRTFIYLLMTIITIIGIFLTTSRMGLIISGVMILLAIYFKTNKFNTIISTFCILFVITIYVPITSSLNISTIDEITSRFSDDTLYTGSERTTIWLKALSSFDQLSFLQILIGSGTQANYTILDGSNAHNSYLEFLLDYGFIGLFTLFILIFFAFRNIYSMKSDLHKLSLLMMLVCILLSSISISPFVKTWTWIALSPMIISIRKRQVY